jgi:oxygen-independent coproporphyrinogen-3 oxidase
LENPETNLANRDLPLRELSSGLALYIHIPFCKKKCSYCDFYSESRVPVRQIGKVLLEIRQETECLLSLLGYPPIETVFIGGGTPSLIHPDEMAELLNALGRFHHAGLQELTVEANPESLSADFLSVCERGKVTRLSLGIQTFQDVLLRILGRSASSQDNFTALKRIEKFWKNNLNIDLITGIPGQNRETLREDLCLALDTEPEHISLYSLTLEENTPLWREVQNGRIRLEEEEYREELWLIAREYLMSRGYENYEISNFALPGKECLHNLRYWEMAPYLGIGPGAVSTLPGSIPRQGEVVVRLSHSDGIQSFLEKKNRGLCWERITPEDFVFENLMMGLRLKKGISRERFKRRFGLDLIEFLGDCFREWRTKGLAESSPDYAFLTERGRLVLNRLLLELPDKKKYPEVSIHWPA